MDDNMKALLEQKKVQLKIKQQYTEILQYKDHLTKSIEHFSQNTDMRMKRKHSKLKPLSQNLILCNRGNWRSKKFAHIPMGTSTCAF